MACPILMWWRSGTPVGVMCEGPTDFRSHAQTTPPSTRATRNSTFEATCESAGGHVATVTLPELLETFRRRAVEAASVGATAPVATVYEAIVGELAPLCTNGNGRTAHPASPEPDHLLTAQDVAQRLHCSKRLVYARARAWPFTVREGRLVRFSAAGLDRWLARRP